MPRYFANTARICVLDFKKHDFLRAQKNVSNNEPCFQGHFPDYPVFPGVLILEAMAQATALLDFKSNERDRDNLLYYFVGIDKARFKKPVFPGDEVYSHVNATRSRGRVWKFNGVAKDNADKIIAESTWSATIIDKN